MLKNERKKMKGVGSGRHEKGKKKKIEFVSSNHNHDIP